MKIFKSIYRLDFPLSYRLVDKLGEYLEFIHKKTDEKPFSKHISNISMIDHAITNTTNVDENVFTLRLLLNSLSSVVEFKDGYNSSNLAKFPLFKLTDELLEKIENNDQLKYNRIGFRSYIIIEDDNFEFSKILDLLWNYNKTFTQTLSNNFNKKKDIGLNIEASSDTENIHIMLGPFKNEENKKYFILDNTIKEGLIFDIDIYQNNISIPKFKISTYVKQCQEIYDSLLNKIIVQLLGVLK